MMDMSNPAVFISGVLVSLIGMGLFIFGKRSEQYGSLACGLVLMALPIMIHAVLWLWLSTVACIVASRLIPLEA